MAVPPLQDLATPEAFSRNPSRVWEFYHYRRELVLPRSPSAAHRAIAECEARLSRQGRSLVVITQNIDELHRRAGSQNVLEIHGEAHVGAVALPRARDTLDGMPARPRAHAVACKRGSLKIINYLIASFWTMGWKPTKHKNMQSHEGARAVELEVDLYFSTPSGYWWYCSV